MARQYKVSVITPFHNTDDEIFKRSFNSVKNQTLGFRYIEYLIVVHNSSTEKLNFVESLAKGYDNVKVLTLNNDYHTPSSPRNYALKQAVGDYIAFLDSDDILYPDALLEASKALSEENAELCMFRFDNSIDDDGNVVIVRQYSLFDQTQKRIVLHNGRYDQRKLVTGMCMTVTTKLYDGKFIRDNELYFDDNVSFSEDGLYNIKIFALAKKIVICPQLIGYQYYQNDGSAMQTFKRKESDLWELCISITKMADIGWKYGIYMDSYLTEVAASTGAYILCSNVGYKFLRKASEMVKPYLSIIEQPDETKIDSRDNLKTFNFVNSLVYKHPLITSIIKVILKIFHIDLEKKIKRNVSI